MSAVIGRPFAAGHDARRYRGGHRPDRATLSREVRDTLIPATVAGVKALASSCRAGDPDALAVAAALIGQMTAD